MIPVKTGMTNNIVLRKKVTKMIPAPYSDCRDLDTYEDREIIQLMSDSKIYYEKSECLLICQQDRLIKFCHCFNPYYPYLSSQVTGYESCYNSSAGVSCFHSSEFVNELEKCKAKCPVECENYSYEYTLNYEMYPSPSIEFSRLKASPYLREHFAMFGVNASELSYESLRESVAKVRLYYQTLEYMSIEESPSKTLLELGKPREMKMLVI